MVDRTVLGLGFDSTLGFPGEGPVRTRSSRQADAAVARAARHRAELVHAELVALGFALDESVDADLESVRVRAGDDAGEHSLAMETLYREAFVQSEDLGDRLRAIGFALDEEPLPEAPPGPEASLVRVDDGEDEHLSFLRWLIAHQEETRRRQRAVARRHRWHEIVHGEVQLDAQGAP